MGETLVGLILLVGTFAFGVAGLATDLANFGDPPAFFGAAVVLGIAAVAVALDEHWRSPDEFGNGREIWFGRGLIALAVALAAFGFALAVVDSPYRNLWIVLAAIVALDGLSVLIDTHRLVVARNSLLETRNMTDAILGVVSASVGFGFGILGVLSGLLNNAHAAAWLYAGVVLALLSNAFMFDEQAHVRTQARKKKRAPFGPKLHDRKPLTESNTP
jgi:hypothetical protein